MEPSIVQGALLVIDPARTPGVGDVAVYRIGRGFVAHRIVRMEQNDYVFQGDANLSADPYPVGADAIVGPVIFTWNRAALFTNALHHFSTESKTGRVVP